MMGYYFNPLHVRPTPAQLSSRSYTLVSPYGLSLDEQQQERQGQQTWRSGGNRKTGGGVDAGRQGGKVQVQDSDGYNQAGKPRRRPQERRGPGRGGEVYAGYGDIDAVGTCGLGRYGMLYLARRQA
ncbi:hypothetical protein AMATHDRAFT_6387 [Amanita thiersii Skay4041]|uniref:Uncharacterized protein n=1 Tax=Amanita thiersii Skay4041 TaxID=703135 RepID=A0A2A9NES1_9AGAR|nr:hypothetical protein AMATHDRAFT_6387 [Amanita thiersii Skay4041]